MKAPESPYARLTAALVAETVFEGHKPNFVDVLTRYLEVMGATTKDDLKNDMLYGADAIGAFVGRETRTVFLWIETGRFPCSRPGKGGIAARKSIIVCWLFAQELKAMHGK